MRLTFRTKLIAIVLVNAVILIALLIASSLIEQRVDEQLHSIQRDYLPRIGLAPRLESSFERIGRSLEDATAASDPDLHAESRKHADELLAQIRAAGDAIAAEDAAVLATAIEDYYAAAAAVSSRLIEGESFEDMTGAVEAMQEKRRRTAERLEAATRFDEEGLAQAFAAAADAQRAGARIQLILIVASMVSILGLSIWIGRGLFRNLAELVAGFRRFGEGDFSTPIPVGAGDELGDAAEQANHMASRLQLNDWLRTGQTGLFDELRGELEPEQVAERAVACIARYLELPVAAIYYGTPGGELTLLGAYGTTVDRADLPSFRPGEGPVGQAALRTDPTVIDAPADGALRIRTAVVEATPRALVYVPLVHAGKVGGVLELALLAPWSKQAEELVLSVREALSITIEVARARAATRVLLAKTQRQAGELLEARNGLERQAEELRRTSGYKSQFLANMSHELRTPLNAIIGFSEMMHEGLVKPETPEHKEFLGHILASGRHLLQLINDVLDLSKVEAGKLEFHPEEIDLGQIVREVLGILRSTAASRRITVESTVAPEVVALTLDPARLKQVLYNYLSNAIKFTPEGGRVAIRATPEGGESVRIEVEDTGVGIAAADIDRLFAEFQQVGGDTRQTEGTGLGLALTKRLVEAQGGTVGVRSTPGKGSVFHAVLPKVARATPAPASPPRRSTMVMDGVPTVLVVEDDANDQESLASALVDAGYAVEVVSSGAQALARSRERTFDAITLDLLLPDMSGIEVLRQLRNGRHQHVPIIVVTVVAERGAVAGFAVHDVLPKPIDGEVLVAALLRAGVTPSASRTVLVVDDDPAALQLMSTTLVNLGYRTRCEADGEAALAALQGSTPTAIVLDLLMPGMSGFEFLDHLRRVPSGKNVPVIVWTSKDLTREEHAVLKASADAVVQKGHGGSAGVIAELATQLQARRVG